MLRNLRKTPIIFSHVREKVKFPDKFKGTIIERWADYWKNLFIDYRQMLQDLRTDIQDEPRKAVLWTTGIALIYSLAKNNPTELDFKNSLKNINNEVILVSEECQNPKSTQHLRYLDVCYNEGLIHYRNLGIVSIMYTTEINNMCDLYKAHCTYLKPTYLSYLTRIVDVGFVGKWWNIYIKTNNYDVNV